MFSLGPLSAAGTDTQTDGYREQTDGLDAQTESRQTGEMAYQTAAGRGGAGRGGATLSD